jgi:hypothetical protein
MVVLAKQNSIYPSIAADVVTVTHLAVGLSVMIFHFVHRGKSATTRDRDKSYLNLV